VIPMIQGTTKDAAWRICPFFFPEI